MACFQSPSRSHDRGTSPFTTNPTTVCPGSCLPPPPGRAALCLDIALPGPLGSSGCGAARASSWGLASLTSAQAPPALLLAPVRRHLPPAPPPPAQHRARHTELAPCLLSDRRAFPREGGQEPLWTDWAVCQLPCAGRASSSASGGTCMFGGLDIPVAPQGASLQGLWLSPRGFSPGWPYMKEGVGVALQGAEVPHSAGELHLLRGAGRCQGLRPRALRLEDPHVLRC